MKKIVAIFMLAAMLAGVFPMSAVKAEGNNDWEPVVSIDDPVDVKISSLELSSSPDSILVNVNADSNAEYRTYFCMFVYNYQTEQWIMAGGWQQSNQFEWKPDSNDNYAVVVYAGYKVSDTYRNSNGEFKEENIDYYTVDSYWQGVSRPQMGKHVIADCAVPESDGLLFGCTSNVNSSDSEYFTTCYIWSAEKQAWIAQASYQASDSAWFKVSSLSEGTYMMYTCTEKMENGQKRKLSCRYYLFSI